MANLVNYYDIASCSGGKWTKDGFIFIGSKSGSNQIWRKNAEGICEQVTFMPERVMAMSVAPNGEDIFFTSDKGGNEQEQIYFLKKGKEPVNLTNNDSARYQLGGITPDGKTVIFACNARNPKNFDICRLDVETGEQKIILQNSDSYNTPAALSPDGKYLLYNKLKGQSDNCMWIVNLESGEAKNIDEKASFAQYTNPVWKKDGSGFYFLTDKDSQFKYLAYYCMNSGNITKLYEEKWDIEDIALSFDGKYLSIMVNRDGYSYLEMYNTLTGEFENIPAPPKGVMGNYGMSWAKDSRKMLFTLTSGKRPPDVWLLDMDRDAVERQTFTSLEGVNTDDMAEPELHHYKSFDGLTVPYWYFKAKNRENGPVVIDIHGGPESQKRPTFDPLTQYLLSEGFSIVAPNIRGSVGYGKNYHHLDDVEKRLDSVADIDALVKHLIESGRAQKDNIGVKGGSYGGYMTLSCIAHYPDLWAAAVDTVGMSNLETFLENTSEYRRAHRESEYGTLEHDRETLRRVSPIFKVDKMITPLMVIHGANDPRVPVSETEQMVKSLEDRGVPVKYLRYEDEGHGIAKKKNKLDCYPQVVEFLKKHMKV